MPSNAPGLRTRKRKDGEAYYWVAAAVTRRAQHYKPATVRLHGTEDERAQRCLRLTEELMAWLAQAEPAEFAYDGSIGSLIRCYRTDEDSPYQGIKHATRKDYDFSLGMLETIVGMRLVKAINRKEVMRWYRQFREPAEPGGPERIRRAHGCMTMLRIVVNYGVGMVYDDCAQLSAVLSTMQFEQSGRREEAVTFEQAKAVVERALELGAVSVALAQALQFECGMRLVDVVGYWEPAPQGAQGLVDRGERWTGGVTWSDVSPALVLRKKTTKTGAKGEWDLTMLPLVMMVLPHIPPEQRVGPMVIFERTGLPYRRGKESREWRKIARAVGIPDHVHNRDSRAGAITEGDEAGADLRNLQKLATHADQKTTGIYIRSTTRKATDNVATLRVKARKES